MRAVPAFLTTLAMLALARPASAAEPLSICPDRPGKGTGVCTVPTGHLQVEIDAADLTHDKTAGQTTSFLVVGGTQLKYGVADWLDVEASVSPYQRQTTRDASGKTSAEGGGDFYLRGKFGLIDEAKGGVGVSVVPYVKVAAARRDLGNGKTEYGVVAPVEFALLGGWKLDLTTEADRLADTAGGGRHWAGSETVGINHSLGRGFTGAVELWGARNWDPSGLVRQYSVDLALAWAPKSGLLQLDGGVNLGLNRQTPDVQLYGGLSRLF